MTIAQIPKALTTGGNSAGEKAILTVVETQVKGVNKGWVTNLTNFIQNNFQYNIL